MHVILYSVSSKDTDGWVMHIPAKCTRCGTSAVGEGCTTGLEEAITYLYTNGYDTIEIFTIDRDTKMSNGCSKLFNTISWNYITANQVDYSLRQMAYGQIWN